MRTRSLILVWICGLVLVSQLAAQSFNYVSINVPCSACTGGIAIATTAFGINPAGDIVGTYNDLSELMELNHQGRVHISSTTFPLSEAVTVLHDLDAGKIVGRAVLVP